MDTEVIKAAKAAIDAGQVTQDGRPLVSAMEAALGRAVTAAERDAAYDAVSAENVQPDPDEQNGQAAGGIRPVFRWVYTGANTKSGGIPVLRHTVFIGGLPAYMAGLKSKCKLLGGK